MRKSLSVVLLASLITVSTVSSAASKTVILSVPDMTCPVCPITVKKALSDVNGVSQAEIDYDRKEARVTYDDTKTDVEALRRATANAGYPSAAKGASR